MGVFKLIPAMAQAIIIDPLSPLAKYLQQESSTAPPSPPPPTHPSNMTIQQVQSFLSRLFSPPSIPSSAHHPSPDDLHQPASPTTSPSPPSPAHELSERLKYLICSSFLLNPDLQPAFYDSHPTPPMVSDIARFPDPSSPLRPNRLLDYVPPFHLFRPQPRFVLGFSTLLIIIGYNLSSSWFILSLPIISLTLLGPSRLARLHHHHANILPHRSPQDLQLAIQKELVPQIAHLVNKSQALDLRISRAIGAVKEIECVALGLGLSNPMPPVSRLETASFPFALTRDTAPHHQSLHALGVRKVLQRVLDQARHDYQNTALELESVLVNPALNPSDHSHSISPPSGSSITLAALMEMYGCSPNSSNQVSRMTTTTPLKRSASERARRQAWRASLHSRVHDRAFPTHTTPTLDQPPFTSTPPNPKRLSLQTPISSHRSVSDSRPSHLLHLSGSNLISRQPRSRVSLAAIPSPFSEYHHVRSTPSTQAPMDQFSSDHHTPPSRSRPLSLYVTRPPSSPVTTNSRSSLLIGSSRSRQLRSISTSDGALRALASSASSSSPSSSSHSRPSPEFSPRTISEAHQDPSAQAITPCPEEEVIQEPLTPYSLSALQDSFERMHICRKRLMCCLLALDFTLFTPTTLRMWQGTLETVRRLLETVDSLGTELTAGMSSEFGPGSFDNTPVSSRQDHHRSRDSEKSIEEEGQEDKSPEAQVRNFAPPIPACVQTAKRQEAFLKQMQVMDLALRAISAKMKVCVEELDMELETETRQEAHQPGPHGQRAVSIHDSIRADLESLAREWDQSRRKIRTVVEGEKVIKPGQNRLRPESLDSNEGSSISPSSGRASSIYSSEVLTPVGEHTQIDSYETDEGSVASGEVEKTCEGSMNSIGRLQPMVPPPGLEEILKGVDLQAHRQATRSSSNRDSGNLMSPMQVGRALRLTAEERLELDRRRQESIPPTIRGNARSSRPSSLQPFFGHEDLEDRRLPNGMMVTELKDVLSALKTSRRLEEFD